jgi:hypothetical protein
MTNAVNIAQSGSNNQTMRNRIINGAMMIDQRNAGATVAAPTDGQLVLDRFAMFRVNSAGVYSVGQSSTAPTGFTNSMLCTVTTADASVSAGDYYLFYQAIEGYNVADLGFGTANAKTVTVSFWVRSSVTGTYAVSIRQGSGARAYVTTYVVNSANTWEQKTVTIPGDTSSTWNKTNGAGLILSWDLGSGSNYTTTANSWQSGNYFKASGCVDWISTSGATFYITGVQLEEGTAASPFENRLVTTELSLCQRYFYMHAARAVGAPVGNGSFYTSGTAYAVVKLPVTMRTTPSLYQSNISNAWRSRCGNLVLFTSYAIQGSTPEAIIVLNDQGVSGTSLACNWFEADLSTAYLGFSAEL